MSGGDAVSGGVRRDGREWRVGILGCGRISTAHVAGIAATPSLRLTGVCDLDERRASELGAAAGVTWHTSLEAMVSAGPPDVVAIMTPSGRHAIDAAAVLRSGCHAAVEKPVALALADVAMLEGEAAATGRRVFCVLQNRYNRAVRAVRDAVASGRMGRIALGTVRLRWSREQAYYDQSAWRGTWAMDGGALTNQGIHCLDVLLHLLGDVEAVAASTATQLARVEVEDTACAVLRFASGALGAVEVTTAARPRDFEASVSVLGEGGTAVLSGIALNELQTYTPDPGAAAGLSEEFENAYGFGHRGFYADLAADLAGLAPHPLRLPEGARVVRLLHAIYVAAAGTGWVRLADEPEYAPLGKLHERPDAPAAGPSAAGDIR